LREKILFIKKRRKGSKFDREHALLERKNSTLERKVKFSA
jgi:hypothetical protein